LERCTEGNLLLSVLCGSRRLPQYEHLGEIIEICCYRWDREAGCEVAIKVIDLENVEDDITDIHRVRHIAVHIA
jgi:hypothetical protein